MWIRFLKTIGKHQEGACADLDETVARAWIDAGQAVALPEDPVQRAAAIAVAQLQPLIEQRTQQTQQEVRTAATAHGTARPNVRSTGGMEFNTLEPVRGGSEVEKRRGPGNYFRSVVLSLAYHDEEAHRALTTPWDQGGYGCSRAMTEGSGPAGGYSTPVAYESAMFEVAAEQSIIVPGATEVPLAARETQWPALNQFTSPSSGQTAMYGGIQVYRKGENKQRTETDPKLTKVTLAAQDLTAYTEISRDLVQDSSVSIDGTVTRLIGGAIGWREDWESINGTGAGQFLGYINAPCSLLISRNTPGHIKYQDVFTMRTRMLPGAQDPCWIVHPYALYDIETLQDPSSRFIFMANAYVGSAPGTMAGGGITYKPAGTLLGWPIYTSEKVPQLGNLGDLALVDRKKYLIGRRSGLEIGLSEHFKFDTDEIAIRAKVRNDGQPWLKAPIYLADGSGSNQVSAFVVLQ